MAIVLKAQGGDTQIIKAGDLYSSCFRYQKEDYIKDCFRGGYYKMKSPTWKLRRISKAAYDKARKRAIAEVEANNNTKERGNKNGRIQNIHS